MSGKRTLREQLEYIKPLEETTLYVKNIVAKFGKVTGSVAFGVDSAHSTDVLEKIHKCEEITMILKTI